MKTDEQLVSDLLSGSRTLNYGLERQAAFDALLDRFAKLRAVVQAAEKLDELWVDTDKGSPFAQALAALSAALVKAKR